MTKQNLTSELELTQEILCILKEINSTMQLIKTVDENQLQMKVVIQKIKKLRKNLIAKEAIITAAENILKSLQVVAELEKEIKAQIKKPCAQPST